MTIDIEQERHNLKRVQLDLGGDVMSPLELNFLRCAVSDTTVEG